MGPNIPPLKTIPSFNASAIATALTQSILERRVSLPFRQLDKPFCLSPYFGILGFKLCSD